jgi:hypothetical protein
VLRGHIQKQCSLGLFIVDQHRQLHLIDVLFDVIAQQGAQLIRNRRRNYFMRRRCLSRAWPAQS